MAIDPGGSSGVAVRLPDGKLAIKKFQTQEAIWDYLRPDEPRLDVVIIEEWQYFEGIARPEGVLTAGIVESVKGICYVLGIPISLRTPGSRMAYLKKAKEYLRKTRPGWVDSKPNSHECDALAHLLAWEEI